MKSLFLGPQFEFITYIHTYVYVRLELYILSQTRYSL